MFSLASEGSVPDAIAAIRDAGGEVVGVNEAVGAALVSSSAASFLAGVRGRNGIKGVGHNHSIGTLRPGMPHRYVEELPETAGPPIPLPEAIAAVRSTAEALGRGGEGPLNGPR